MNFRAFIWAVGIYVLLSLSALGSYTLLNFGPLSTVVLTNFVETSDTFLVGLDTALIFEFLLLVVLLPLIFSGWLWRLSTNGQIRKTGELALGLAVSAITLLIFFLAIDTRVENNSLESINPQRANTKVQISLPNGAETNVVHIFVESLSSELYFSGEVNSEPIEILEQSMGQNSITGSIPWDFSVPLNTINGLSLSLCGTRYVPEAQTNQDSCLPGYLDSQGYENVFFQSASGAFQDKQNFLEDMSFKVYERETWQSIGALDPDSSWGQSINDGRLFNHGRSILQGLYSQKTPFYLAGLSLDTHAPHYVPSSCVVQNGSLPERAYLCSMDAISKFISWSRDNATAPTLLILQGDHPAPEAFSAPGFKASTDVYFSAICTGTFSNPPASPRTFSEIPNFISKAIISCV